jgi:hypothetical protein
MMERRAPPTPTGWHEPVTRERQRRDALRTERRAGDARGARRTGARYRRAESHLSSVSPNLA